mgnify:CR=1 FL=1
MYIVKILGCCLMFILSGIAVAQDTELYKREYHIIGKESLPYRMMLPKDFDETKTYPLVLFLHGAGERGNDNELQLTHGASLFADNGNRERFPAIVIFPQCPVTDYWSNVKVDRNKTGRKKFVYKKGGAPTKALKLVMSLMEKQVALSFVDTARVYVVGLSMGGMGTFEILARKPQMFAAAMPICGGGHPQTVTSYAGSVPLWIFHGAKDDVVGPGFSIEMVSAILGAGGFPRFTLFDSANHNSWDPAFREPDFLSWLFDKSTSPGQARKGHGGNPQ